MRQRSESSSLENLEHETRDKNIKMRKTSNAFAEPVYHILTFYKNSDNSGFFLLQQEHELEKSLRMGKAI